MLLNLNDACLIRYMIVVDVVLFSALVWLVASKLAAQDNHITVLNLSAIALLDFMVLLDHVCVCR